MSKKKSSIKALQSPLLPKKYMKIKEKMQLLIKIQLQQQLESKNKSLRIMKKNKLLMKML